MCCNSNTKNYIFIFKNESLTEFWWKNFTRRYSVFTLLHICFPTSPQQWAKTEYRFESMNSTKTRLLDEGMSIVDMFTEAPLPYKLLSFTSRNRKGSDFSKLIKISQNTRLVYFVYGLARLDAFRRLASKSILFFVWNGSIASTTECDERKWNWCHRQHVKREIWS